MLSYLKKIVCFCIAFSLRFVLRSGQGKGRTCGENTSNIELNKLKASNSTCNNRYIFSLFVISSIFVFAWIFVSARVCVCEQAGILPRAAAAARLQRSQRHHGRKLFIVYIVFLFGLLIYCNVYS